MQKHLFIDSTEPERIAVDGGDLILIRDWLDPAEAERFLVRLRNTVPWEQSIIQVAGKRVAIPRLNAWYGDEGMTYRYSGKRFQPLPWSEELVQLKARAQDTVACFSGASRLCINSALLNLYRDGNDGVGWHSDDEPELGPSPQIASLSLGAPRRFVFRYRSNPQNKLEITLPSGSLLLMLGDIQKQWQHRLPKTRKPVGERINVTFRQVFPRHRPRVP